ncbi:MAG: hypothetical protein JSW73_03535 [Candidatus Woesearchaeota archaeon]|nr:MAG: hypothetical protein JSW73_03535 [Candidatus Woesearchaeota archaeon]
MNGDNSKLLKDRNFIIVLVLLILIIVLAVLGYFYANQKDTYTFKFKFETDENNVRISGIKVNEYSYYDPEHSNGSFYSNNQEHYLSVEQPIEIEFTKEIARIEFEKRTSYNLRYSYSRGNYNVNQRGSITVSMYINGKRIDMDQNTFWSISGEHTSYFYISSDFLF